MTPSGWFTRARVQNAQRLLETTDLPIEQVASAAGLGSGPNLRAHFSPIVGTSPTRYRTALDRPDLRLEYALTFETGAG